MAVSVFDLFSFGFGPSCSHRSGRCLMSARTTPWHRSVVVRLGVSRQRDGVLSGRRGRCGVEPSRLLVLVRGWRVQRSAPEAARPGRTRLLAEVLDPGDPASSLAVAVSQVGVDELADSLAHVPGE